MSLPYGLRKPHHLLALVPVTLAFLVVAGASFLAFEHLTEEALHPRAAAPTTAGAGLAPTLFQPELLTGLGIVALLLVMAYGAWRYHSRNRANDPITEQATREAYRHPDRYSAERSDFQDRIRPS